MQTKSLFRATLLFTLMLCGCSQPDDPYSRIQGAPLVRATLHTANIVTPHAALPIKLDAAGYLYTSMPSNYPAAVRIESMLWKVPEDFTATSVILMSVRVVRSRYASAEPCPDS